MDATSRFTPEAEGCFSTDAAAAELVVLVLADGAAAAGTDRGGLEAVVELSGLVLAEGADLAGVDGGGLEAAAAVLFALVLAEGALAATANDESSAF